MRFNKFLKYSIFSITSSISGSLYAANIPEVLDSCETEIFLTDQNPSTKISSQFTGSCESINYDNYNDPYNPTQYNAKYYSIEVERDADIKFNLSSYSTRYYLHEGNGFSGNKINLIDRNNYEIAHLSAGIYTLELINQNIRSFNFTIQYNDLNDNTCIKPIELDLLTQDGWHIDCDSTNRNYTDPYSPSHYDTNKAKFFTFSIDENKDLNFEITSNVNTYTYLLDGGDEFSMPLSNSSLNSFSKSLTPGTYTLEVTTINQYDPGTFSVLISDVTSDAACTTDLIFNTKINSAFNQNCSIQSSINGMTDPYAGADPERAAYYEFSLVQDSDLSFAISNARSDKILLSVYQDNNFLTPVVSNGSNSPFSSIVSNFTKFLQAGNYTIEITKQNQLAIGNFEFQVDKAQGVSCENEFELNFQTSDLLNKRCLSIFREGDNQDPYGAQTGDYYAKRYAFTVDQPTSININQTNASDSASLYLSKKIDGQHNVVIQSSVQDNSYYSSKRTESLNHCITAGDYLVEATTFYPEQTDSFSVSFNKIQDSNVCHYTTPLNTNIITKLKTACESEFKNREYSYVDPYSSSNEDNTKYYFANQFSFYVDQEKEIFFEATAGRLALDLTLSKMKTNHKFDIISEQPTYSMDANRFSIMLEAGFYQLEVSSAHAVPSNYTHHNINLVISDGSVIDSGFDSCSSDNIYYFNEKSLNVIEGNDIEIMINRTQATNVEQITLHISTRTGILADDYIINTNELTFNIGETSKSVIISAIEYSTDEPIEKMRIHLGSTHAFLDIFISDQTETITETDTNTDTDTDTTHSETNIDSTNSDTNTDTTNSDTNTDTTNSNTNTDTTNSDTSTDTTDSDTQTNTKPTNTRTDSSSESIENNLNENKPDNKDDSLFGLGSIPIHFIILLGFVVLVVRKSNIKNNI